MRASRRAISAWISAAVCAVGLAILGFLPSNKTKSEKGVGGSGGVGGKDCQTGPDRDWLRRVRSSGVLGNAIARFNRPRSSLGSPTKDLGRVARALGSLPALRLLGFPN